MKIVKLILGIVEICFLPALIIMQFTLGFQLGVIHWIIAVVFFGLGISNIRKATAKVPKDQHGNTIKTIPDNAIVNEDVKQGDIYQFALKSYKEWANGYFDSVSDYYKSAATKDSAETLSGIICNETSFKTFLDNCFAVKNPGHDEILFSISPDSFMLTNKHLYIKEGPKEKTIHHIHLCDIKAYTNKGLWMKSGVLTLTNNVIITVKLDAVPDEKKIRQLQQMLSCNHLINIS